MKFRSRFQPAPQRRVFVLLIAFALFLPALLPRPVAASATRGQLEQTSVYLPVVDNNRCHSRAASGPFGVQMFGATGKPSKYYPYLLESGAQWVRAELAWSGVEPENVTPSQYNWSGADQIVGAASDGCLNLIITHETAPFWAATSPSGPIDKVPLSEFTDYIGALVERYDGDGINDAPNGAVVRYWEFYNEPDGVPQPSGNHWGHVGGKYAEMLKAVYPVVKAANPNAQVVFGGIAYDRFDDPSGFQRSFVSDVLTAGGGDYFDIMNIHVYPPLGPNWTTNGGPGLYEKVQAVRAELQKFNVTKPFVVTETGDHNNLAPGLPGSDESQTRHVVKLYTQTLAASVEFSSWFLLYDLGGSYPYDSGLVTAGDAGNAPTKKLAYSVYQQAVNEFKPLKFDRVLTLAETKADKMEAYRFINSQTQQVVYVAWLNPIDASTTKPLQLTGSQATVRDMFGQTTTVLDKDDGKQDGKITIKVSGRPVYIEM